MPVFQKFVQLNCKSNPKTQSENSNSFEMHALLYYFDVNS